MKDRLKKYLLNKSILILGYGREGKSVFNLLLQLGLTEQIGIADINKINIEEHPEFKHQTITFYDGDNYLEATQDYDVVIKSPGVIIKDYLSLTDKKKITSSTDLFLRFCSNKIIGITGTKGKSTTSSIIYHLLKENNYDVLLMGNIGIPCFDMLDQINKDTIIVYELSCHQLEFIQASPDISVLLNVYEEHLDHYNSLKDYVNAKKNIYKYQKENDYLIYGDIFEHISNKEINSLKLNKINLYDNPLAIEFKDIKTSLIGEHNLYNIILAIIVCDIIGLSKEKSLKVISKFKGLPHRLEYIGKFHNIHFYNDSIATAQEAVINAVNSFSLVNTIIIGGMDRDLNYSKLVQFLCNSTVENIILLPETHKRINELFVDNNCSNNIIIANNMEDAVNHAFKVTKNEGICLLSPAAASYGFYKNFEERGNHFKELVKNYI
ncbi:MAG: UDP-N-acetylmuramoyl-L-alanine--D-glutamate ligase [Tenericutes bacterium]|nr:UDP-N-acetylmuramoyl-L-alanine--D-glutamate ligase [Mycoplasmatota bacterium]